MRATRSTNGNLSDDVPAQVRASEDAAHAQETNVRPVRVAVVDDHPLLRDAIRNLLHGEQDMEWVGEAADGAEAVDLVSATQPDVVLMDLSMPGTDGLSATRLIVGSHPTTKVLVLTSSIQPTHVTLSLTAGATGVLTKDGNPSTILTGIRSAACSG